MKSAESGWSALIVDDDASIRQSIRLCLEAVGAKVRHVATSAGALEALERSRFDVVFLDLWLGQESGLQLLPEILRSQPGIGVVVVTAFASYESAVEAMKMGAADYLPKPFTPEQVRTAARRVITANQLRRTIGELQERLDQTEGEATFETRSPDYARFLQTAARAAASDAVVLLQGESGTGKNVLARWLRKQSRRHDGPFVTVHCPLLSNELMSSVLFGHKKGAFTGALADAIGKVEEAEGGTLFLDEAGDLPVDAQSRLLRFLNDQTYERVGEAKERQADVRLIAATNRDLSQDVREGRFREDLLFRLNVISLTVPSLRDRFEDILPMAERYLQFFRSRQRRGALSFSKACVEAITAYGWPGNLRQLRNAVERAVILSPSSVLEANDLGLADVQETVALGRSGLRLGAPVSLEAIEREHIARVLAAVPSYEAAARTLGIDVTTLQRKRRKYGLS